MSIVLIKQIPDDYAETTGLAKYNRSRMPGCKDSFQASYDEVTGSYITGLDDELARELSKNGKDYTKGSSFWEEFMVTIDTNKPRVFNTDIPADNIAYKLLVANGYVAPDRDSANTYAYRDALYYAYTEESEDKEEIKNSKVKDKARSILLDISENKEKMTLYGQYLEGIKYSEKFKEDTLYKMLRAFIEEKDIVNAQNFIAVTQKPVETIQQKIIVDKALKQRLIQRVSIGNKKQVYQYGQITVGTTIEDVYKNLASVDFAPELIAIKKELESK